MKYYIVNVNHCLAMSQYAPFFYEHIYRGELVMLENIEDTCQLDKTYRELLAYMNRKPCPKQKGVLLLLIPRDFGLPLRPQDYELYNDINTFLHLLQPLDDDVKVYTFYVDRTGELEQNDGVYQRLNAVRQSLQAEFPELESHFLSLKDCPSEGDYREYLRSRIEALSPCTKEFYRYMLKSAPEVPGGETEFNNGINLYIGEAKRVLSEVKHIYAPIYRTLVAEDIEESLKIIYYIKDMLKEQKLPEEMAPYENYAFEKAEHVRRLLVTYQSRLSLWACAPAPISREGIAAKWEFRASTNAAEDYHNMVYAEIEKELKSLDVRKKSVDVIFDTLNKHVTTAWQELIKTTERQSALLLNPDSYVKVGDERFDLDDSDAEDKMAEAAALAETNQYSPGAADIPDFSAENRLEQELEQINHQINQIVANLNAYTGKSFALTLLFALLAVAGLYVGAQYSIFINENSWWIFGVYLLVSGAVFSIGYLTVRRRYKKEIAKLLGQCVDKVANFLRAFLNIAKDFEKNIYAAGRYACLKRQLDEKAAARKKYHETMRKYDWHKMKVQQILRNLAFFQSFIGDAVPYEESAIALDLFDHDAEHTEFYHLKVFRR